MLSGQLDIAQQISHSVLYTCTYTHTYIILFFSVDVDSDQKWFEDKMSVPKKTGVITGGLVLAVIVLIISFIVVSLKKLNSSEG